MASSLRLGVIGLGNIGQTYIDLIESQQVQRVTLGGVSSRTVPDAVAAPHYADYRELLAAGCIDAVLIATPTMHHPQMAVDAAQQGLHVLVDKPLAMSVAQAEGMLEQIQPPLQCAVMLNQRFHPHYHAMQSLISSGAIGAITRVSWTMTAWYRPDVYYQVSPWRGTWPGEGGGLLINQCIHNLDVLQWLTGLPSRVSAIAGFGKYHAIDVEDEFTATLSYDNGATGVIVASSGEAPGINQLDIVGDRGMLRFDGTTLTHWRSDGSVREHCRDTDEMFGMPAFETTVVDSEMGESAGSLDAQSQHAYVLQNFVDAVLDGTPLITPAREGLASLHLANGILLSAWAGEPVDLPLDTQRYEKALQQRIAQSSLREATQRDVTIDMGKSFR